MRCCKTQAIKLIILATFSLIFQPAISEQTEQEPVNIRLSKPKNIPAHWKTKFILEPIFNSKILIVESGLKNSDTVLLVHGLGQNGFKDWLETIKALENQYHILTLDLPGFGHSGLPSGRFSPKNYAKVLHWLLQKKRKNKVHLIGHSMGAAVSLQFGADYPDFIKSVILVDVAGILQRTAFIKNFAEPPAPIEFLPENIKEKAFRLIHLSDSVMRAVNRAPDPTPYLQKNDLLWKLATHGKPNVNAAYALIETDFSEAIKKFPHPTTLIWGENDHVTPIRTGKLLAHHLKRSQLFIIKEAGHVPMKSQSNQFTTLIKNSLINPPTGNTPAQPPKPGKNNLQCRHLSDKVFTGNFDRILIENCIEIDLDNISARTLTINNSIVHINNSTIESSETACIISDSTVIATNTQCIGDVALEAKNGLLDFAGSQISGKKIAARLQGKSQLILSVSAINSPIYQGSAHTVYITKPEDGSLILEEALTIDNSNTSN